MQTLWNRFNSVVLVLVALMLAGALARGALSGPLDPPGTPGPTMKTLDQVEARIPISSVPYTISQPGSYYLTGNMVLASGNYGITLDAEFVTLDLNGFNLSGPPGAGAAGIFAVVGGSADITIRNGSVSNWNTAINTSNAPRVAIEDVTVRDSTSYGIYAYTETTVLRVLAISNGGDGIYVGSNSTVRESSAVANGDDGIVAIQSVVEDCVAEGNTGDGIQVSSGGMAIRNWSRSNIAAGIHVISGSHRVEDNAVSSNAIGIDVDNSGNVIARNTARSNTTEYDVIAGNAFGPVVTNVSINTDTNPWSNIDY